MWKEMLELRAPEKRRTGMEINPNVKYPDQTEAAIIVVTPRTLAPERAANEFNVQTLF
jgi:hypothetical protein